MKLSEIKQIDLTPGKGAGTVHTKTGAKERESRCLRVIKQYKLVYSEEFGVLITIAPGKYQRGLHSTGTRYEGIPVKPATVMQVRESWVIYFYPEVIR